MRRVPLTALLFLVLASCSFYRPVYVGDSAATGPQPKLARASRGVQVCREVRRVKCDTVTCRGSSRDLVTLSCAGGQVTRCEIARGGC